jgi:DNA-binding MarR family transcriptional regulator
VKYSKNKTLTLNRFVDRITDLTPMLCRAMIAQEERCAACDDIGMAQLWALEIVAQRGRYPQQELLKTLRLKPSTGTVFLDRMEREGYLRRARDPANRRAVHLEATAKGLRAMRAARRQRKTALRILFKPLNPKQRAQYVSVLESLTFNLTARSSP